MQTFLEWGRGGGQVVSVSPFYSDDPSSSPAEAYSQLKQTFLSSLVNPNFIKRFDKKS